MEKTNVSAMVKPLVGHRVNLKCKTVVVGGLALRPTNQPSSHLSSPTSYSGGWEWLRLRLPSEESGTNFDLEIRADIECRQSDTRDGSQSPSPNEAFGRLLVSPGAVFKKYIIRQSSVTILSRSWPMERSTRQT